MNSIKSEGLDPRKKKTSKIIKTSLALVPIVFAITMSSPYSFFQIIKPAEAAGLTSIAILPTNNIVNTRTTYDIIFKTATTTTIKIIHMSFPSGFDVSAATRLIERSGIGSGSLSAFGTTTLIYTVSSPVSVPAGTTIRLEIGRIVNSDTAGSSFKVSIATENTTPIIIDGPTLSPSFPIKDITGNDVSPNFMIRKTLLDDSAGNALGWNPNGAKTSFVISDADLSGIPEDSSFVSIMLRDAAQICTVVQTLGAAQEFVVLCNVAPQDSAELHYIITKLPSHVIASSSSVTASSTSENKFTPPSTP